MRGKGCPCKSAATRIDLARNAAPHAASEGPAVKTCLVDWRSNWSKTDRNRKCDRASVSNVWTTNPFGMRPTEVLVAVAPHVLRVNGVPTGSPDSYNARMGELVDKNGWSEIAGQRITTWTGTNGQSTTAFDITNYECRMAWAELAATSFPWAAGLHVDYATSLGWLAPTIPADFWKTWDEAFREWSTDIYNQRMDWKLLGQQYHLTPITSSFHGLFVEEHPQHTGTTLAQHTANMATHGGGPDWVFEIRSGWEVPAPEKANGVSLSAWTSYVRSCLAFIEQKGCYCAFGRDAKALVGVPA